MNVFVMVIFFKQSPRFVRTHAQLISGSLMLINFFGSKMLTFPRGTPGPCAEVCFRSASVPRAEKLASAACSLNGPVRITGRETVAIVSRSQ